MENTPCSQALRQELSKKDEVKAITSSKEVKKEVIASPKTKETTNCMFDESKIIKKTPESVLEIVAKVTLWLGIIASGILSLLGLIILVEYHDWSLFLLSLFLLPISVTTWAFLRVIANISNSLKEINQKTK